MLRHHAKTGFILSHNALSPALLIPVAPFEFILTSVDTVWA